MNASFGSDVFFQVGVVITAASACAIVARILRLPPLIGYIAAGVALGPLTVNQMPDPAIMEGIRHIAFTMLLFLVGIELDWEQARRQLQSAWLLVGVQLVGSFAVGLSIAVAADMSFIAGCYLSIALSFSSAVVAVKQMAESKDLNSLHGRLSVSILWIQDILAVTVLVFLSGISSRSSLPYVTQSALLIAKVGAAFVIAWFSSRYILPFIIRTVAKSSEVLTLVSLGWCFFLTLTLERFGLPKEMGAFVAGASLATLPYSIEVVAHLRSIRDFFVILLFVGLGGSLVVPTPAYLLLTLILMGIVLIARPLISYLTLSAHGYRARTAFLASITQGQIGEFSLVITAIAITHGHMGVQLASSISATAIVSIFISTILYTNRGRVYKALTPVLRLAERGRKKRAITDEDDEAHHLQNHIIIFGYHRTGYHILRKVQELGQGALVVDFNPDIIERLRKENIPCVYGDAEDEQILEAANIREAAMVVSTIPHSEETHFLIQSVKHVNPDAKIIVTAHTIDDALQHYKDGAHYVLLPHQLGGEHIGELIDRYHHHSLNEFMRQRAEEIRLLRTKQNALYCD